MQVASCHRCEIQKELDVKWSVSSLRRDLRGGSRIKLWNVAFARPRNTLCDSCGAHQWLSRLLRDILQTEHLQQQNGSNIRRVTLIGDAAYPMSPFKGQGANQALLDALSLARALYKTQRRASLSAKNGIGNDRTHHRQAAGLNAAILQYEAEMVERSAVKVKASADAAQFLHTDIAIQQGNITRGAAAAAKIQCTDTESHSA